MDSPVVRCVLKRSLASDFCCIRDCALTQIVLCTAYNERVDVFSFGLTLLEIVLGDCTYIKKRFKGRSCYISKAEGGQGWRPPVPDALEETQSVLVQLIGDCVLDDFSERPAFLEIADRLEECRARAHVLDEDMLLAQVGDGRRIIETNTDLNTDFIFGEVTSATKTMVNDADAYY